MLPHSACGDAANCSGGAPAGPPTLAVAGLAAAELRAAPMVLALDPRHRLHAALRAVEALRARYASGV